ncbi:chemotaxis protein CheD [Desulfosporosinus hippei]|uniref:Probable chemoreceptor glutamine deamidase CheD n=1 Tax=Desulfosporosinus hippei DSM 8344 TaxID=1121419 RepID=A0A1G7TFA1_9FIRM|nr:chemotaxis protein CheD [Desulfosporosinus hippei]SDG34037.1 chemotaxis protein CheD [Desulfosporosinus hippei DSM 8344]
MDKIVGIGEYGIAEKREDFIKTYALASCVAVTAYNPDNHLAGMIHIALPHPVNEKEGQRRPIYYATSGIPIMIDRLRLEYGCQLRDLQVKLFGGADSLRVDDYFKIGQRNIKAVRETLLAMNLKILDEQIGGYLSRSITMSVSTGQIEIKTLPINC